MRQKLLPFFVTNVIIFVFAALHTETELKKLVNESLHKYALKNHRGRPPKQLGDKPVSNSDAATTTADGASAAADREVDTELNNGARTSAVVGSSGNIVDDEVERPVVRQPVNSSRPKSGNLKRVAAAQASFDAVTDDENDEETRLLIESDEDGVTSCSEEKESKSTSRNGKTTVSKKVSSSAVKKSRVARQ
jgi:hypothetical protein